jgi:ribosomal protein S18 acetylase RimI-like enzyme
MKVRSLEAADLPAAKTVIDSVALFPSAMLDDMTSGYLGGAHERWLVADDGGIAGVLYAAPERMTEGTWNLLLLAVRRERQGKGVGRRLVEAFERWLAGSEQRVVIVETSGLPEFDATRRFYESAGYKRVADIPDFYRSGEDKIVYWKRLRD